MKTDQFINQILVGLSTNDEKYRNVKVEDILKNTDKIKINNITLLEIKLKTEYHILIYSLDKQCVYATSIEYGTLEEKPNKLIGILINKNHITFESNILLKIETIGNKFSWTELKLVSENSIVDDIKNEWKSIPEYLENEKKDSKLNALYHKLWMINNGL